MGIFGLAFVSCMAMGASLYNANVDASAEVAGSDIFTETKCQISNDGERMLLVTGIKDVSLIYELGYEINNEEYEAKNTDTAETDTYYESLTLGSVTKTANEFIEGAQGLLVWEIDYDSTIAYSVKAYAYVGELNDNDQLIAPDQNPRTYATAKNNFNVFEVKFEYEDGEEIATKSVNYGAKVTAPEAPEKDGFVFKGWYNGAEEFDFVNTKITSATTITAKYVEMVNYTVEVLAAKYNRDSGTAGNYYVDMNTLSYVDKTSEYATLFGLDSNNQLKAEAGTVVSLVEKVATLQGAVKVNAESVLSATVAEDGLTKLTVKLDFDETALGFKLSNMRMYEYNWDNVTFELTYMDGICGLLINTSNVNNGKSLEIDIDDITMADYAGVNLKYKEKSAAGSTKLSLFDDTNTESAQKQILTVNANAYVDATTNLGASFSTIATITKIRLQYLTTAEKHIFIGGIEKINFKKETITYSVANGNLADIATPIGNGTVSTSNFHFAGNGNDLTTGALVVSYTDNKITANHQVGFIFDLGGIKLSDYKTVKITYQAVNAGGGGALVYCDGIELVSLYGGAQVVDIKALAEAKGLPSFNKLEISPQSWVGTDNYILYIASIELVLNDA